MCIVRETNVFWKDFQDWLVKSLMSLKPSNPLSLAAVLGLQTNFFLTQNNTSIS